jgi:SAM-dependent methyltransferase
LSGDARKFLARALLRGERVSASLRTRIDPAVTPPSAGRGGADGAHAWDGQLTASASPNGRYEELWKPLTVTEAIAEIYNTTDVESFERGGRLDFDWLAPFLSESTTVLDFGCGIGRVARYVAPACKEIWAVDISARMLELATRRMKDYTNVHYVRSQDTRIPDVPTASIDLVYSLLVLQHVEREDAFLLLEELRRVLRRDGRAVLTFPNLLSDIYLDSFVHYARSGASTQANRARVYTPQEVERILGAAGFDAELDVNTEIRVVARPQ